MSLIEVRFKLEKETKGALRYQEVDEKGEVIEQVRRLDNILSAKMIKV